MAETPGPRVTRANLSRGEYLVLALALGSWATLVLPNATCVPCGPHESSQETARRDLVQLHLAATRFQLRSGAWPTLAQLWRAQHDGVFLLDFEPVDPWGEEYDLFPIGGSRSRAEAVSAGPDREFGTDDDLWYPEVPTETR